MERHGNQVALVDVPGPGDDLHRLVPAHVHLAHPHMVGVGMHDHMIRYAEETDISILSKHDKHISKEELENSVRLKRILVLFVDGILAGWLRYNLF